MSLERNGGLLMGGIAIVLGVGLGVLMWLTPENANPDWPFPVVMLFPAVFVLGGLLAIGHAAGRSVGAIAAALILLFVVLLNVYAFVVPEHRCVQRVGFLGIEILARNPSQAACDFVIVVLALVVDAVVVAAIGGGLLLRWRRARDARAAALAPKPKHRSFSRLP